MPIEFYCPGCGNLMRTPDETAGRKGRCPTCQLKVQIPANSVAATSSESAVPRSAIAASPKENGPEPIRFDCGSCGKTLSIPATNAGKKGQCPHCGKLMSIPWKSPVAGERWKGTPKQKSKPTPTRTSTPAAPPQLTLTKAGGEKIEFHCSNCREVVRVGAAAAGKKGQCPRCKAVIQIPLKSTSITGLQPILSDRPTASPRPQPKPTTPTPGLTPLPNLSPASSELTPLDGLDVLSPLDPLGLTPLGPAGSVASRDGPFGGDLFGMSPIDDGNPFAKGSNPYSAPRLTPAIPVRSRGKGARTGAEIVTMICGGCLIFYAVLQMIAVLISFVQGTGFFYMASDFRERFADSPDLASRVILVKVVATIIALIQPSFALAGGIQMIRFKVWGLCLAACILTMVPCNGFCLLGLPLGIWGTVMLSLGSVRSVFR
jgi:DNA-directed RNA polymerase subunit M/transcription elongation factor TFIIS